MIRLALILILAASAAHADCDSPGCRRYYDDSSAEVRRPRVADGSPCVTHYGDIGTTLGGSCTSIPWRNPRQPQK
jgi:hypothetical protein